MDKCTIVCYAINMFKYAAISTIVSFCLAPVLGFGVLVCWFLFWREQW